MKDVAEVGFAYSWPAGSIGARVRRKLAAASQAAGVPLPMVPRRSTSFEGSEWQTAPFSITKHIAQMLSSRVECQWYDWTERVTPRLRQPALFLAHPYPFARGRVWEREIESNAGTLNVAITPMSYGTPEMEGRMEAILSRVDASIGIMGPVWWRNWGGSGLARYAERVWPVDMAIDASAFPFLRKRFNPPGRRRFLYLGREGVQKGTHLLEEVFEKAGHLSCCSIGTREPLRGIEFRPWTRLEPGVLAGIVEEFDFLITMGVSDANPTTILEGMALGLVVAATPESGYDELAGMTLLNGTDPTETITRLTRLTEEPEDLLLDRAIRGRREVEERYNWDRFEESVEAGLDWCCSKAGLRWPGRTGTCSIPGRRNQQVRSCE